MSRALKELMLSDAIEHKLQEIEWNWGVRMWPWAFVTANEWRVLLMASQPAGTRPIRLGQAGLHSGFAELLERVVYLSTIIPYSGTREDTFYTPFEPLSLL